MKFTTTTAFTASLLAAGAMGFHPAAVPEDDPSEITLTGVVRDFKERTAEDGHTDFERRPNRGFGLYCGNVAAELDSDGKPVFSGEGFKVGYQWRNSNGQNICWRLFDSSLGGKIFSLARGQEIPPQGLKMKHRTEQIWFVPMTFQW